MKETKHILYLCLSLAMLIYAVPKLNIGDGLTIASTFTVVWLGFALTVIAANLHAILGINEKTGIRLSQVKRMRQLGMAKPISHSIKALRMRK